MQSVEQQPKKKFWKLRVALILGIALLLLGLSWLCSGTLMIDSRSKTRAMIMALTAAYTNFVTDNGSLPPNLDNQSLYKLLSGDGPDKRVYINLKKRDINTSDELVDERGTAFRVSRLSNSEASIISAGPDKVFGTPDDITNQ